MSFYYLLYLWMMLSAKVPVTKIAKANQLIKEAESAYKDGHFVLALVKYRYLINSLQFREAPIQINLAHCYFMNNDKRGAQKYYEMYATTTNNTMQSIACQQLGVIAFEQKKYKTALEYFKQSLMADPHNEDSRYNYELVARNLPKGKTPDEEEAQQKKDPPADQQEQQPPPENEDTVAPAQAQTNKSQKQDMDIQTQQQEIIQQKLQQINLTPEKAQMILDAMKNSEIQYIQQRKKQAPAKEEKNLPDW